MKLKDTALKVVVPEKKDSGEHMYEGHKMYADIEASGYNQAIDQTLQSELPDVGECVELDVEEVYSELMVLVGYMSTYNWLERSVNEVDVGIINKVAKAIATSKDILKWKKDS